MMSVGVCLVALSLLQLAVWPNADGANILVFMPMPLKSHFSGFQPMFEELAHRGHNVTVVSTFPLKENRRVTNYTDIDVSPPSIPSFDVMQLIDDNFITSVLFRWYVSYFMSDLLNNKNLEEFIRSESNSFDLVIVEAFHQEYTVTMGHKFNAPVINLASTMIWVSISKWLHVPSTFSYIPDCCIGMTDDMNFLDRLKNTITGVMEMYAENYLYLPMMKSLINTHFTYKGWESRPPLEHMLNNVSLILINTHYAVGVCRPFSPNVIQIGGMHIKKPKPLPQNLQDFIGSATDGVILFSFGSIVNLSNLPNEKLSGFLNVISRLRQKVIIKWVPDESVKLPQNVMTGSWLPQYDILAHQNVKLFITHGGLHSIEEALYNGKPVVGMPFFADQYTNLRLVEKNGYGKLITFFELTEKLFEDTIKEVLSNPKFIEKAMVQSLLYKDQSMKPMDRAIYWIEYVIRNDGAKYLKSNSIGLDNTQYFLLDVTLVVLVSMGLITWLCFHGVAKISSQYNAS